MFWLFKDKKKNYSYNKISDEELRNIYRNIVRRIHVNNQVKVREDNFQKPL